MPIISVRRENQGKAVIHDLKSFKIIVVFNNIAIHKVDLKWQGKNCTVL